MKAVRFWLVSLFAAAVLLEAVLRVSGSAYAGAHWLRQGLSRGSQGRPFTVLCLGDSFTFGVGAAAKDSYPAQLQRMLQGNGEKGFLIINGGRLANTSSLLLENLRSDLDTYRPDLLVIMVGCNNYWNLRGSSYFHLKGEGAGFRQKLDSVMSNLRFYQACKIGYLNLKSRLNNRRRQPDMAGASDMKARRIDPDADRLVVEAQKLYETGEYALSREKLDEALARDEFSHRAHFLSAMLLNIEGNDTAARDELWRSLQAARETGEWDGGFFCNIINICLRIEKDIPAQRRQLSKMREFAALHAPPDKKQDILSLLDAKAGLLDDNSDMYEVARFDIGRVAGLARQRGCAVILQTYPAKSDLNSMLRRVSKEYGLVLADNELFFEERGREGPLGDLFVADGHCSAAGYNLIAANVYAALADNGYIKNAKR